MTAVTCSCGRVCASRSGFATHARACRIERARRDAYVEAIEAGLRGPELWAQVDAAVVNARAAVGRPVTVERVTR